MQRAWIGIGVLAIGLACSGCGPGVDPDVRRGNLFFENKKYDDAFKAYEQAVAKNPKNLDLVRPNMKKAYYYFGGALEMSDSLDGAVKYYEKGFALDPSDAGMCNKLAQYFWEMENFEKAGMFFNRLVELDGEAPDTPQKWKIMGEDYYAQGYCMFESKKYPEALEAFKNSLKVSPKGKFAPKAKDAMAAVAEKMKKQ